MSLSNTDLIFRASIVSEGERPIGVFVLGVILYTCRNCWGDLSVGVPCAFLRALFKVSTNLSAWPFDLGWYCGVVMCFSWYVSQNCLNSLDVNCILLSVTTQSTTLKRANSSCTNPIMQFVVGFQNFQRFSVAVDDNEIVLVIQRTCKVDVDPLPRLVRFLAPVYTLLLALLQRVRIL